MSQLTLLPEPEDPRAARDRARLAHRATMGEWRFHRPDNEPIKIEQRVVRCDHCQAALTIQERVHPYKFQVVFRLSPNEHALECVARNPTDANIEKALADAWRRNATEAELRHIERAGGRR